MASPQASARPAQPHIHLAGFSCPVCDQPIPHEKADQVRARIDARDRDLADKVAARMKDQFAQERVQFEANARAVLEQTQRDNAAAVQALNEQFATKETAARAEATQIAQAAAQAQIDGLLKAQADLRTEVRQKLDEAAQAKTAVEMAARERVAAAETAKLVAENEAKTVKENHAAELQQRLGEQREALEKDKQTAVLAEQAKTFDERQKLQGTVQQLQRQLEKERADVVGEGAKLELYEELKGAFEGDRIRRVPKGTAGADIVHEIVENGKVCGKIVYDSKKRSSWRSDYASKLCEDKTAEGAEHAILSLLKFPADAKQIDVRDGVILLNPARVVVVAGILRDHIVQTHALRISNQEREKKKGELYAHITSERFRQQVDAVEAQTDKLLDIDVAEEKAHRAVWEKRGGVLKTLQKAHGNLRADIARILGTRDKLEDE